MVKLTKIYTRTGDAGETHLAGGHRTKKFGLRIQAIGDIDELNCWFGLLAAGAKDMAPQLFDIQQQLFNLGAQLAILPADKRDDSPDITQADIDALEADIDRMNTDLPMLKSFILPGGNQLTAQVHIARAVCRRAERSLFALAEKEPIENALLAYINRLSDWLFVLARYISKEKNIDEVLWSPTQNDLES